MTASRTSDDSSPRSDLSTTISNPNSSPTTPPISKFQPNPDITPSITHKETADDDENCPPDPVKGWPKVALLMAETPDFAAFAPFRDLNIKSLLYYQTELTRLRARLHQAEWRDKRRGIGNVCDFAERADFLIDSRDWKNQKYVTQWEIIKEIRLVLKEYNEALLQYTQICALPAPEASNTKTFRKWLRDPNAGDFCITGDGDQDTWGTLYPSSEIHEDNVPLKWQFLNLLRSLIWPRPPPTDVPDLVATHQAHKVDGLTRWIADEFIPFYHNFIRYREKNKKSNTKKMTRDPEKASPSFDAASGENPQSKVKQETLTTYSEKAMLRFTSSVSTVIACLLPTVAITVLSKVHGLNNLLICLAGFATVFSVGLIYLTSAATSRIEIFTATAAFSAVLVVFISVPTAPIT